MKNNHPSKCMSVGGTYGVMNYLSVPHAWLIFPQSSPQDHG